MKLVFIHGWGLNSRMWDGVCALLTEFEQEHIDLGFYEKRGQGPGIGGRQDILVGHSLGFMHGMNMRNDWRGWIAINSFPRFVKTDDKPGCTSAAELRDITLRLKKNPQKTLHDFHNYIGAVAPEGTPDFDRLREGLTELRDSDVTESAARISPGLVIASRNDPLVPVATSEALSKGKEICWHETAGHILPQTDAAFCAQAIRDFMRLHDLGA